MNSLQTVLQNAIIGWWEDTLESYDGPDDPDFVQHVCETIGISEEEYKHIMAESADVEEWLILSNNSACDDLSVHTFVGTKQDAYKKMQAMVLATAARIDERCQIVVDTNPSEMTAFIQWTDIEDFHEDFKVVKKTDAPCIDAADGVADTNLDAIPDDISWDDEAAHIALFNLYPEDKIIEDVKDDATENKLVETFDDLLVQLKHGRTFEDIAEQYYKEKYDDDCLVECIENVVYEDGDLYTFFEEIGIEIEDYFSGYVVLKTEQGMRYEIPYEEHPNRFGDAFADEGILLFDWKKICAKVMK